MINYFRIAVLFLSVIACSKQDCVEESSPLDPYYITLESKEGERFCLPYSGLRYVTPFDSLVSSAGKEEREEIACGVRKLSREEFEKIGKQDLLMYRINGIDPEQAEILTNKIIDSSGVFRLRDVEFNLRGDVIRNAIDRGYVIRLSDDRSEFFWKR